MNMRTAFLLFAILALLSAQAYAYDISGFLSRDNHFLNEGETLEQPTVKLIVSERSYWVVPVIGGDSLATFMPLYVSEPKLETSRVVNRKLFEAADVLRGYMKNKKAVAENAALKWYVTSSNARKAGNLSTFLSDEVYQMGSIDSEMNLPDASGQISKLTSMLASMSMRSASLQAAMQEALDFESSLSQEADASDVYALRDYFDEVSAQTDSLESEAIEYRSELEKLKQMISSNEEFDIDTKASLLRLADPPAEFDYIGNWALDSDSLKGVIDSIYSTQASRTDALLEEFEARPKMDAAYKAIYGPDEELSRLTPEFTSLSTSVAIMLSNENKPYWKNKTALQSLQNNWQLAQNSYNRGQYADALQYAERTKADVKAVKNSGFPEAEPKPLLSQELITLMIIILVTLLIVVYVYRNRRRFLAAISGAGSEEEVSVSEFGRP